MTTKTTPSELAVKRHLRHLALEGKSPHTIRRRDQALQRLAKALPCPLLDATPEQLYEWRAAMRNGTGTIAVYLSHIRSFYRWAADEGVIPVNPVIAVPVPKPPKRLPRPIPEADLMHALALTTPGMPVRLMLVLGGWCGLRIGEIAGLRVQDLRVNDRPPVVIVSHESAKGRKERVVELSPFVVAEIQAARLPLAGYVFTDANGAPLTAWFASRITNQHLRGSGTRSTFHALRHRFASLMYQATNDYELVGALLGHAPGSTATANYAAFSRTGATAAVAALPVPGEKFGTLVPNSEPLQEAS
jgi:integrase/recombinase XerC